jgi:endonuclease/exonuclease/phosphatase family metal-dependent hydrolase
MKKLPVIRRLFLSLNVFNHYQFSSMYKKGLNTGIIRFLFAVTFLFSGFNSIAEDIIRIMQYNLLYYGINTSFCTADNNNLVFKEEQLGVIIDYFKPDILAVNEMGRGADNVIRLQNNSLNIKSKDYYRYATYTNLANSSIVNAFYYNSDKFVLYRERVVNTILRDINLYTLYFKSENLVKGDTIFLTCLVTHLKAGQESSDQQTRTAMVTNAMDFLNKNGYKGNLLFMGDFNMRSSYEQAYQLLTSHPNPDIRFYDPVNAPGIWGLNSDMAIHHTQSPRTGSHDCFVTGGLDDRYDFILASGGIINGSAGLEYIKGTYQAIGQDGKRYKQSVISPVNHSQPTAIINAIYNFSDHLPVQLEMRANLFNSISDNSFSAKPTVVITTLSDHKISISIENSGHNKPVAIGVFTITGQLISQTSFPSAENIEINMKPYAQGLYIIRVMFDSGQAISGKALRF